MPDLSDNWEEEDLTDSSQARRYSRMMIEARIAALEKTAPHAAIYVRKYELDELPNRRAWPGAFQDKPTDVFFKYLIDNNIKYEVNETHKPGEYT